PRSTAPRGQTAPAGPRRIRPPGRRGRAEPGRRPDSPRTPRHASGPRSRRALLLPNLTPDRAVAVQGGDELLRAIRPDPIQLGAVRQPHTVHLEFRDHVAAIAWGEAIAAERRALDDPAVHGPHRLLGRPAVRDP